MAYAILLVDDQRDIVRLLHSALDSLKNPDLEILEAPSGEEALLEVGRRRIDLVVIDYLLPGMNGVELMHKLRAGQPDVKVVLVTGITDRRAREEMLNAGAAAIFDKPVPLGDFLGVVERSLGLDPTIFPSQAEAPAEASGSRFSDLLANFRQDLQANAVFLINSRGLVVARAGGLRDSSMEVSLVSALTATFSAGLKVAKSNRQEALNQYFVFTGGDHDLILMPVDPAYSLLLAGKGIAGRDSLVKTIQAMITVRNEVVKSLRSIGATGELNQASTASRQKKRSKADDLAAETPEPQMEAMLEEAATKKVKPEEMDDFWDKAAEQHSHQTTSPETIPYEEARKRGLTPDEK